MIAPMISARENVECQPSLRPTRRAAARALQGAGRLLDETRSGFGVVAKSIKSRRHTRRMAILDFATVGLWRRLGLLALYAL